DSAGDDRGDFLHAELEQRRVGRRLHLLLREAAVVSDLLVFERRLAVPGLGAHREVAERIELRALLGVLRALVDRLAVERVRGARDAGSRLRLLLVRAGERR